MTLDAVALEQVNSPSVRPLDRTPRGSPWACGPVNAESKHAWLQCFRF